MSIVTRTLLDQIEIRGNGIVQLRLLKQVVADGRILQSEPHRAAFEPGTDCAAQAAFVDSHLQSLGFEPLAAGDWQAVRAHIALAWTPDVLAAWQAAQGAA